MTATPRNRVRLSGTNLERAADHNQRVTLHAIRVNGSLTRVDLARIIGLSHPAVANITKRLMADGLIQEAGHRRGGRGQPPTNLIVNPSACYAIGVNIDRDHITIVVVDFAGTVKARTSREVAFALPGEVQALYRESIEGMLRDARVPQDRIVGVGVAIPDELGAIDLPGRPEAYIEWDGLDMAALFADPLGLPVFIENDAAAAATGELQLGLGQGFASFFYILISAGLGGGVVIDGAYFRGADGRSGELGLMRAVGRGPTGQVQSVASLSGLAQALGAAGFTVGEALAEPRPPAVVAVVEKWIETAARTLIEPLIAVNCLINPAAVLIGGRLPSVFVDRLAARLQEGLARRAADAPVIAPVRRAALSDDAPAVGAAILPFSHFLLPRPGALWKTPAPSTEA